MVGTCRSRIAAKEDNVVATDVVLSLVCRAKTYGVWVLFCKAVVSTTEDLLAAEGAELIEEVKDAVEFDS